MNLDSLSLALSQISYLVDNLTKKNYRASQQEIQHIVNRHGPEADRHLLRCLFSHVDFSGDGKSSGKDFHQVINVVFALKIDFLSKMVVY
uniref:CCR4-NOT transcription complex subunit 1 n=1 Tax=Sinocyclocheilus grahami TaxID=75366 RepID=A0A672ST47_SINGR